MVYEAHLQDSQAPYLKSSGQQTQELYLGSIKRFKGWNTMCPLMGLAQGQELYHVRLYTWPAILITCTWPAICYKNLVWYSIRYAVVSAICPFLDNDAPFSKRSVCWGAVRKPAGKKYGRSMALTLCASPLFISLASFSCSAPTTVIERLKEAIPLFCCFKVKA